METPVIELALCDFVKARKALTLTSDHIGKPSKFYVHSHHSNTTVLFTAVQPGDPMWDEDGWDGEQCIYRPTTDLPNVEYMCIYNTY